MSVPPELVGAWRRAALMVEGERQPDPCQVMWLQTPSWYADIRLPLPGGARSQPGAVALPPMLSEPWSFGGVADWADPVMTWGHHFDLREEKGLDSNRLELLGDLLVEQGTTTDSEGRPVRFSERWERVSPSEVLAQFSLQECSLQVRVGAWAIYLEDRRPEGAFLATLSERRGRSWRTVGVLRSASSPLLAIPHVGLAETWCQPSTMAPTGELAVLVSCDREDRHAEDVAGEHPPGRGED